MFHITTKYLGHKATFKPQAPDYKNNKKANIIEGISATTDIYEYFELMKDNNDLIRSLKIGDTEKNGIVFFVYEFIHKENFKSKVKIPDFLKIFEFISLKEEEAYLILAFWVSHADLGRTSSRGTIISIEEAIESWNYQKKVISMAEKMV